MAKRWTLLAESELRCEVSETEPLYLRLVEGSAELHGIEIPLDKEFAFIDDNFAVFTWYGCVIETTGGKSLYTSDSTPMVSYVNTHIQLEAMRDVALGTQQDGPSVLIVGPPDSGKSTMARILLAYAARLDRHPVFVDLDAGQSSIGIPGCIGAMPVEKASINIEVLYD